MAAVAACPAAAPWPWQGLLRLVLGTQPRSAKFSLRALCSFAAITSVFRRPYARLAFNRIFATGDGHKRAAFKRRRPGERDLRQLARLTAERKILAQRKIRIAFPHQNSPQVRMSTKANAHHVVNLALVPIGGLPDRSDGGQLGLLLAHIRVEAEMRVMEIGRAHV